MPTKRGIQRLVKQYVKKLGLNITVKKANYLVLGPRAGNGRIAMWI